MDDPKVDIIYEGAFLFYETLVRTDVLIRKADGWKLVEAKCSSSLNEKHYQDISIQYYVLKNLNIKVSEAVIAHLNTDFIFNDQKNDYKNLKIEVDVLETIESKTQLISEWIKDLLPITIENAEEPDVGIGDLFSSRTILYFSSRSSFKILKSLSLHAALRIIKKPSFVFVIIKSSCIPASLSIKKLYFE